MKIKPLKPQVRKFEREIILSALAQIPNKTQAAAALGITTETIRKKLSEK